MRIIPVIDLKDGLVVHAKQGNRDRYAPLISNLCPSADALELIQAFKQKFNFGTVYIADLNAITRQGNHNELVREILLSFPDIEFWLDCGFPLPDFGPLPANNYVQVVGSESLTETNLGELTGLNRNFILSLDFSSAGPMGAGSLFTSTVHWPNAVIAMTLAKVGSNAGPDIELLKAYRQNYPEFIFAAAGGIRNRHDLEQLRRIGIEHCLIASALHNGKLNALDIAALQAKKYPG